MNLKSPKLVFSTFRKWKRYSFFKIKHQSERAFWIFRSFQKSAPKRHFWIYIEKNGPKKYFSTFQDQKRLQKVLFWLHSNWKADSRRFFKLKFKNNPKMCFSFLQNQKRLKNNSKSIACLHWKKIFQGLKCMILTLEKMLSEKFHCHRIEHIWISLWNFFVSSAGLTGVVISEKN